MRLDRDKRYQIKALLAAGLMQKEIAKLLDVKEPTLSREISRNGGRICDMERSRTARGARRRTGEARL